MGSIDRSVTDALSDVGISPEKARAVSDSIDRAIDQRYAVHASQLAMKSDLAELKLEVMRELTKINDRISQCNERISQCSERISQSNERISQTHERISQTNERVSSTDARIAEMKAELIKWMLGAMVAQTGLLIAAMRLSLH